MNVRTCARYYFNKHCVKIILEIAQMLYAAQWILNDSDESWLSSHHSDLDDKPYRKTHINHPTTKWVRHDYNNYIYTCELGIALCEEYTRRYHKTHKTERRLRWLLSHPPQRFNTDEVIQGYLATQNVPKGCTPIPLAMPTEYHTDDVLTSYRTYYIKDKKNIAETEQVWLRLVDEWKLYN